MCVCVCVCVCACVRACDDNIFLLFVTSEHQLSASVMLIVDETIVGIDENSAAGQRHDRQQRVPL